MPLSSAVRLCGSLAMTITIISLLGTTLRSCAVISVAVPGVSNMTSLFTSSIAPLVALPNTINRMDFISSCRSASPSSTNPMLSCARVRVGSSSAASLLHANKRVVNTKQIICNSFILILKFQYHEASKSRHSRQDRFEGILLRVFQQQ